jgi:hypothetical protein
VTPRLFLTPRRTQTGFNAFSAPCSRTRASLTQKDTTPSLPGVLPCPVLCLPAPMPTCSEPQSSAVTPRMVCARAPRGTPSCLPVPICSTVKQSAARTRSQSSMEVSDLLRCRVCLCGLVQALCLEETVHRFLSCTFECVAAVSPAVCCLSCGFERVSAAVVPCRAVPCCVCRSG